MITITVYGLDQYTVGHYSREHTENLAQLFETSEDNISFYSPNAYIFHKGVEQTSWNAIIKVNAPEKYEVLEEKVSKYLIETFKEFSINLTVEFYYYHSHHRYEYLNNQYPHFIDDDNLVNVEESDEDEELYEGNIFEGMEKKLEEAYAEGHHCHCKDGECECEDGECECGEGECHCDHHKN